MIGVVGPKRIQAIGLATSNFSAAFEILGNFCDLPQLLKFSASFESILLLFFFTFLRHFLAFEETSAELNCVIYTTA